MNPQLLYDVDLSCNSYITSKSYHVELTHTWNYYTKTN